MQKGSVIVSDTSSLIILSRFDRLDLLNKLFEKVLIPQGVYEEIVEKEDEIRDIFLQASFFETIMPTDKKLLFFVSQFLDKGESEAITLAKELNIALLIDERKGRRVSKMVGVSIFGFIGLLQMCVMENILTKEEAKKMLQDARNFGFRISPKLQEQFLQKLQI